MKEGFSSVLATIKTTLPILQEMLADIRSAHGYLNLPKSLHPFLSTFDQIEWAQYYEDKNKLGAWLLLGMFGVDVFKEIIETAKTADQAQKEKIRADITEGVIATLNLAEQELEGETRESIAEFHASLTDEERKAVNEQATMLWIFLVTHVCNDPALSAQVRPLI